MMNAHRHRMARKGKKYGANDSRWQKIKKYAPMAAGALVGSSGGLAGAGMLAGGAVGHLLGGGGGGRKRHGGSGGRPRRMMGRGRGRMPIQRMPRRR